MAEDGGAWVCSLPHGRNSLGAHSSIHDAVALANEIHRWLDAHLPAPGPAAPMVELRFGVEPPGSIRRRMSRRALRARIDEQVRAGTVAGLAAPIILDCVLERLQARGYRLHVQDAGPDRRRVGRRRASWRSSVAVSALVMAGLASTVVGATHAISSDQVAMAAVAADGGTLDIKVDSSTSASQDGPGANWGTFSASLSLMKPGETRYADITLRNPGSLPARVTVTTTGSDTHADYPAVHCFAFWFRERDGTANVQSIGDGSALGTAEAEAGVVDFHPGTGPSQLYADGATRSDAVWASGEAHAYRVTVRMRDGCLQGGEATAGATGSLTFSIDGAQA